MRGTQTAEDDGDTPIKEVNVASKDDKILRLADKVRAMKRDVAVVLVGIDADIERMEDFGIRQEAIAALREERGQSAKLLNHFVARAEGHLKDARAATRNRKAD